jgi:folate-binding protein YgfZ
MADDALLLLLRGGDATSLAQSLQRFVFRAKVKLTPHQARPLGTGPARDTYAFHREDDAYTFGCGTHSLVMGTSPDHAWRAQQIREGWPWLPDDTLGELLAPSLSLERLQAVALDKGCYPGQEIVARLHYRGGNKRHMHCVVLSQTLPGGTVLRHDDKEIGQLLDVAVDEDPVALAVIDDEVVKQLIEGTQDVIDGDFSLRVVTSWPA